MRRRTLTLNSSHSLVNVAARFGRAVRTRWQLFVLAFVFFPQRLHSRCVALTRSLLSPVSVNRLGTRDAFREAGRRYNPLLDRSPHSRGGRTLTTVLMSHFDWNDARDNLARIRYGNGRFRVAEPHLVRWPRNSRLTDGFSLGRGYQDLIVWLRSPDSRSRRRRHRYCHSMFRRRYVLNGRSLGLADRCRVVLQVRIELCLVIC